MVDAPVKLRIAGLKLAGVRTMTQYDLLAKKIGEGAVKLEREAESGVLLTPVLALWPMPVVVIVDLGP